VMPSSFSFFARFLYLLHSHGTLLLLLGIPRRWIPSGSLHLFFLFSGRYLLRPSLLRRSRWVIVWLTGLISPRSVFLSFLLNESRVSVVPIFSSMSWYPCFFFLPSSLGDPLCCCCVLYPSSSEPAPGAVPSCSRKMIVFLIFAGNCPPISSFVHCTPPPVTPSVFENRRLLSALSLF